jgi:glycerate kinase
MSLHLCTAAVAMKITVAPDSLKESLSAPDAAGAIARGLRRACAGLQLALVPMADGGEGTTEAITEATGGTYHRAVVHDPLGRPVEALWGECGDGRTAVVEMARASGLELLQPGERNPMLTSTRGTGELIGHALDAGADRIIVGIGGSATVDGGTGMASALGVRFLDADGAPITDCRGGTLERIRRIDLGGRHARLEEAALIVASDVTNPLLGPEGAAHVYGPQKGATPEQVEQLERGLARLAGLIRRTLGLEVAALPGAGAAGGLGAGLVAFLGARLQSGAQTVAEAVRLREKMAGSDLVITAEGRLDGQSAFGKATGCVAAIAQEMGVPVVALAGALGPDFERLYEEGMVALLAIQDRPMPLEEALSRADGLLERAAEAVLRLWIAAGEAGDGRT